MLGLTLAIVVAGAFMAVPRIRSAHAAGASLVVSPQSQVYESGVYINVHGFQFGANETVDIYWNYTGPGTGTLEQTAAADSNGDFATKFLTPLAPTATYTIAGVGTTSGLVGTDTYTLLPQLYIKPEAGAPGAKVHIYGNAFGNAEQVKIYWNYTGPGTGTLMATATGNSTGSFNAPAVIPAASTGTSYPIVGVGQTSNTTASTSFFMYPPTLALAPLSGSAGSTLTLSGYGFLENEVVNVYWNNGTTPILTVKTNSNVYGYLPPSTITIPAGTAPGIYPVTAVGKVSKISVTSNYTVAAPGSSLSISSGPVGASVTISGQGYAAGETVNILWNYTGPGTGTQIATGPTNSAGAFSIIAAIPTATTGAYAIAAVGGASKIVTQNTFTIANGAAVHPLITPPNTNFVATGTGFLAKEAVSFYWDTTANLLAKDYANAQGNAYKTLTVPASATPGVHSVIIVGAKSGTTLTTSITVDTGWASSNYNATSTRVNPYENALSTTSVVNLKSMWNAIIGTGLSSSAVYANGIVYITTPDGKLDAYNALSGTLKWQFNSNTGFANLSAPLLDPATGMVFFGTIGNQGSGIPSPFYAVDAQTGTLRWSEVLAWNIFGAPTLGTKTLYIGVARGPNSTSLYSLDEFTGHLNWQYAANGSIWGTVSVDNSTHMAFAYVGNPTSALVALNATTGALMWKYTIANGNPYSELSSGISVANGLAYFDSENGTLYALNESAGTLAWSAAAGSPALGNASTPAATSSVVYVGSSDSNLYAFNATTGAFMWKTATGGSITSSPAVANGVVYVASSDKSIYAMDATVGTKLWSFTTGAASSSSPVIANGWLYCGSTDGNLYAFSL